MELGIKSNDKISIITPFYNPGDYLEDCIKSILNQTYTHWELLLVNDGSTDHSLEIARKYADLDTRIQLSENREKGLISALRLAYETSTGSYITRMDADDLMTESRLELMLQELQVRGKRHVCVGLVKYFSEGELGEGYRKYEEWLNNLSLSQSNFDGLYRECSIPSPNFLIHRDDFETIDGFRPDDYPEDYDLAFRMHLHGLTVCSVDQVTLHWRDHASRSTRTQDHYQPLSFIPLKVKYFLLLDFNSKQPLLLWGAGTKGKLIAKELIKRQVSFTWITENDKKVGHNIYGVILKEPQGVSTSNSLVILGVSNPDEIEEIKSQLKTESVYRFF
jgi:glycosyltransferase involved in cell wall biosynthesis